MKNRKILFEVAAIAMAAMVMVTGFTSCSKANAQAGGGSTAGGKDPAKASAPKVEYAPASDFSYDLNKEGDGIIIKGYTGTNSTLAIPVEIEGYPVIEIAESAFTRKRIKVPLVSVIIPENVKTIGYFAFGVQQSLSSISFPASLRGIEETAFSNTALQHVDLSHTGLTSLGSMVFDECTSLQTVKLPDTLKTIGGAAFRGCTSLQTITLPDTVEIIDLNAFAGCSKLTSANIPANIKEIGITAFRGCSELTSLSIPDTIISVKIASDSSRGESFLGCGKLAIATRKRLQDLGYTGRF
ncbi:hypothetical protein FACS1894110_13690 [Spirochaetia bacterium]|nr:hypothetical protein FACS1894110_13690 [Spirochaetia bacterium]